jgi:hypothetical protein
MASEKLLTQRQVRARTGRGAYVVIMKELIQLI